MADFKFDPLREVKTCSRSSFKLSSDTWQTDFIFNANLFTWVCHFYWSVWTSWTLLTQLTTWKFQRTEQNVLGPDITETIVTAPLNKPTFTSPSLIPSRSLKMSKCHHRFQSFKFQMMFPINLPNIDLPFQNLWVHRHTLCEWIRSSNNSGARGPNWNWSRHWKSNESIATEMSNYCDNPR